jgi:hypothetical protein
MEDDKGRMFTSLQPIHKQITNANTETLQSISQINPFIKGAVRFLWSFLLYC